MTGLALCALLACLPPDDPKVATARSAAEKANQRAFAEALAKKRLVPLPLARRTTDLHAGVGPQPGKASVPSGTVIHARIGDAEGLFVAGPTYWNLGGSTPADLEFVRDADGDVHVLQREPVVARKTPLVICGCAPGPHYGSGCPACGSTVQVFYGPLPPGLRMAEPVKVRYRTAEVAVSYTKTCPPLPPPP